MNPDLDWYKKISKENSVSVRCPFATVNNCPRYYQSLSLLGDAGSTKIPQYEEAQLLDFWKKSDLWPITREYETSISGPAEEVHCYSNFCPEVAFDRFGLFASSLGRYSDEIDRESAHDILSMQQTPANDWRWIWASLLPQHYTECQIYSLLSDKTKKELNSSNIIVLPWYKKYLVEIIVGLLITVIGGFLLKIFG